MNKPLGTHRTESTGVSDSRAVSVRVDFARVPGTIHLHGENFVGENNAWVIGDDEECLVIDAPHAVAPIETLIAGRRVVGIVCTHGDQDHVAVAPQLRAAVGAPILLHPRDAGLWHASHPGEVWDQDLADGDEITVAGVTVHVILTPGRTRGSVCLYVPALGRVFTGDALFHAAGARTHLSAQHAVGRVIVERLFVLPDTTIVHSGHGPSTTIGVERARARSKSS